MRVVIKIGGSVVASPPNPKLISEYAELLKALRSEGHELAVVVGGGSTARDLIKIAREIGLNEQGQDEVAISASRIFAQLLAMKIGGLEWGKIPTTIDEAIKLLKSRRLIIMGGLKPGMTTDTVAAILASEIKADMIIKATDQEGIYTKDPRKYPDAKKLDEITFENLTEQLEENKHKAGIHQIIDPKAAKILKETKIKTIVLNGYKPTNIIKAIRGEKIGTAIH